MKDSNKICCGIICIIIIILLLSYLIVTIDKYLRKEGFGKKEEKNIDFKAKSDDTFVLYYAPWCPFCKEIKSDDKKGDKCWDKLESHLKSNAVNGKLINCYSVDCTKYKKKCSGVDSYPTIKYKKNGKESVYKGKRTYDGFMKFIQKTF
tara:strand:- start:546 stop:992 length:447 start_codon:yes stop_codon:yes gene_type:complete